MRGRNAGRLTCGRPQIVWAFREGVREYGGVLSLLETTITNWDSVLYRIAGGRTICKKGYFDDLRRGYLDVVLSENPNVLGMHVRLLRTCASKHVTVLSGNAAMVIRNGLVDFSFEDIHRYEKCHYESLFVTEGVYDGVKEATFGQARVGVEVPLQVPQRALFWRGSLSDAFRRST